MATLTRQQDPFDDELRDTHHDLSFNIPKPFPSRAEREQEELLEELEDEELNLEMVAPSTAHAPFQDVSRNTTDRDQSAQGVPNVRQRDEDLLPSIGHVQMSCITTLNDLLSNSSAEWTPIVPDRRHSLPPTSLAASSSFASPSMTQPASALQKLVHNLRTREGEVASVDLSSFADIDLLKELQIHIQRVETNLPPRDTQLARTLVSLLLHLDRASSLQPSSGTSTQGRVASWSDRTDSLSHSASDPFASLRREVSDFRLERSWSQGDIPSTGTASLTDIECSLLWTQIDSELEAVLSLCRSHPEPEILPPEYDPGDYEGYPEMDSLPKYEPASDEHSETRGSYKAGTILGRSSTRVSEYSLSGSTVSEKMKMDLEAVTLAIDRLYLVAPQLHNQRVELKKSKLEQMEKARQKGKQRENDADLETKELNRIVELVAKAADRKMVDQAVVIDASFKEKLARARQEDDEKRTAFVEHLARHSDAGRLHSQEAVFLSANARTHSPSPSQALSKTLDPYALLSLPEFIREGVPEDILREMEVRRDAETLLTLPEFIKRYPQPELVHSAHPSIGSSKSQPYFNLTDRGARTPPAVRPGKHRSRSMSEPLAWLLSGSSARASSPVGSPTKKYKSSKLNRPKSSNGLVPIVQEGLNVAYVAEYHENLQHVLAFLTVPELPLGSEVEAEVVPASAGSMDEREVLILRCGPSTSAPLSLPASVSQGKADVTIVGGQHYQIKLRSNPFAQLSIPTGSPSDSDFHTEFLDATHFQTMAPTSFICSSCSLPLIHAAGLNYRDLPSEHWAELVDAWMCHSDQTLHEHVKKGSKDGFWPGNGQALVGGSYILLREEATVKRNLCEAEIPTKSPFDDWTRIRCICGALLGRRQQHPTEEGCTVYRLAKYAFRPISPTSDPIRVPLSAFIVEDMNEYVRAHATYRFVIVDEEEERPRILIWLFKPNMRLAYATPAQYVIPKSGSIRAAKVLFKILGPTTAAELPGIVNKYPGFPQAEHLYYPRDVSRRLGAVLKESNTAYPESMRTMTGLDVGWLQRA